MSLCRASDLASIHRRSWVGVGPGVGELRFVAGRGGAAGLAARGVPLEGSLVPGRLFGRVVQPRGGAVV